ncbi:MAG: sugar transferase [Candidatus Aphodocola sp.]
MIKQLNNTAELVLSGDADIITKNKSSGIFYITFKRIIDLIISIIGIILLIPLIVIVKLIAVLSGDFKSIFYTQDRIGKNGKIFKLYKFRSMIPKADEALKEILKNDKKLAEEYRIMKKLENDPRITKVGKFLRNTSLDEFPQMLNIFFGDMSLVGNRPYLPREKKDMGEYYNAIVKTKPGLTGFWQVSLRSRGTFEQRLVMEKYYSENYNLKFDISIFLKTFDIVLRKKGAK